MPPGPMSEKRRRATTDKRLLLVGLAAAVAIPALALALSLAGGDRADRRAPTVETIELSGRPSAVAIAAGLVWVADDATDAVRALDPATGDPVGDPIRVARNPVAMAASDGALWVAHASGAVMRVDAVGRHAGPAIEAGESITGIAVSGERVWAADLAGGSLVEIGARDQRVLRRVRIEGGPVRVIVAGESLWVTNRESTVSRVDPRTGEVGPTVDVGSGPIGLAFDGERIWVAASEEGTVSRLDAVSGNRAGPPVRVGRGPVAVAITEGTVWVANQDDRTVSRIDAATGELVGRPISLGTRPRGVGTGLGSLWVAGTDPGAAVRVGVV